MTTVRDRCLRRPDMVARHINDATHPRPVEAMDDQREGFGLATAVFCLGVVMALVTVSWIFADWKWG